MGAHIPWTSAEAQRFRQALDMAQAGIDLYRQRMRREHPGATAEEIEELVQDWLAGRPADARGRRRSS